jgi:hypothetical protein
MEGRRGGGGAKSYDGEKAWFSINHSILSGVMVQQIESKTGLLCTYLLRWLCKTRYSTVSFSQKKLDPLLHIHKNIPTPTFFSLIHSQSQTRIIWVFSVVAVLKKLSLTG